MHAVDIEQSGRARVVRGTGELDAFAAPDLTSAFDAIRGERSVVADLSRVSFIDSTALGVIVRAVRALDDEGARVQVVLPAGSARRIFERSSAVVLTTSVSASAEACVAIPAMNAPPRF